MIRYSFWALPTLVCLTIPAIGSTLLPAPVQPSTITLQVQSAGSVVPPGRRNNLASPVVMGGELYVVDQTGQILQETSTGFSQVLSASAAPAGITPTGREAILNMAGNETTAFVAYTSSTLPQGMTATPLPNSPEYASDQAYQVIVRYDRNPDGSLSNPTPLTAIESRVGQHTAGGMLLLPEPSGQLVFATGDALEFHYDGLSAPQDSTSGVSRLLLIDPLTGAQTVAAQGIRNVQQLSFADEAQTQIAFSDIGGGVAEEINVISVADLLDTNEIENFGWGRNEDGLAREGTFYVDTGSAGTQPFETPSAVGLIPGVEPGFITPYVQFGREETEGFFAVSGPIASSESFYSIELLFGDLVNGQLFATIASASQTLNTVFSVNLVDEFGNPITLLDLTDETRADIRLFTFEDGSAGVLLEREGALFTLTEVSSIPLPAGLLLLGSALGGFAWIRRRARGARAA